MKLVLLNKAKKNLVENYKGANFVRFSDAVKEQLKQKREAELRAKLAEEARQARPAGLLGRLFI